MLMQNLNWKPLFMQKTKNVIKYIPAKVFTADTLENKGQY